MKKENQRIMITKRLLREGLFRLLETKDIDRINVTELCREAGINRATFYTHYETPRDILLEVEREILSGMEAVGTGPSGRTLASYVEHTCQYLYGHADVIRVLIRNFSDQDMAVLLRESHRNILSNSPVTSMNAENMKLVSAYLAGGGYYMLRTWLLEDIQKTPQEIAALITEMFPATVFPKN